MRHQSSIGERLAASDDPTDCGHRYSAVFGLPVPESWLSSRAMPSQVTLKPNGSAKLPKAVDGTPLINDLKFGIPEQQPEAFAGAAGLTTHTVNLKAQVSGRSCCLCGVAEWSGAV